MKFKELMKKAVLGITCAAMIAVSPISAMNAYAGNAADDIINKIRNVPATVTILEKTGKTFSANMRSGKVTSYPVGVYQCYAYANEMVYYLFGKQFSYTYRAKNNEGTGGADTALCTLYNKDCSLINNIQRKNYASEASYKKDVQQILKNAVPGDVLIGGDGTWPHFMIYMYSRDTNGDSMPDKFYTAEGNYDGNNNIAVEYERDVNYFISKKGKAMSLYHCKANPVTSGSGQVTSGQVQTNVASSLAINNVSEIGTLNEGSKYSLTGTVTSNYNITNVTGTIYNSNGSSVYTKSVAPNKSSYTLRNSSVDCALLFNYLPAGNYTYKVSASDARGAYKEVSRSFTVKGKEQAASALSISGVNSIGTIKEGKTHSLSGTVTSNYKITNVTGTIYDSNGNTVYTKSVNPNNTSYKLLNSTIDYAMLFNYLAPGSYTYKVSASDSKGGYKENSQSFNIESKNAEAEARARAEAEAKAEEERIAKEEAGKKAEEERIAQEETEAKAEENSQNSKNSDSQIIVLPDTEDEYMSISGDTGKFDLHLGKNSSTESFTAASDKLTIITRGQVEDLINGGIRTDRSRHFSMYLYDVTDGSERYVSGYYANCDNIEGGLEFDVQEGHQYKIRLETDGLTRGEAVIGDGHAYPIR